VERSFKKEVASLRLGAGDVFRGEGVVAVTKALLQSGVSYVGGYPGSPVSHLMDVLADADEVLHEHGVHYVANSNEAGAAAMLSASIHYPLRGAVTWKSTVGTNVASDALSNLASAGVSGGVMIILGEDYGEGASIMQERSHAFAMKSAMWLLDPRPNLPSMVHMIEQGFALSEASHTPVMLELRIRACHVHGQFVCKDNRKPALSGRERLDAPAVDLSRIILPPATFAQEADKIATRLPAAEKFIAEQQLNEQFPGSRDQVGIIMQGGLYNTVLRALNQLGLADAFGKSDIPLLVLNVTYPLLAGEITGFCAGKKAILMVEEGQPDFIEQAINSILRRADVDTHVFGKAVLRMAGEYTFDVILTGLVKFLETLALPDLDTHSLLAKVERLHTLKQQAARLLGEPVPARPPSFCTGCPERPVFSAIKMVEKELGPTHVSADIGCHSFATLAPFIVGNTILGYGLSLASSSAVAARSGKRVISIMGDGGFWHNGLSSGICNAIFNDEDSILIIMDNGYSAATGGQYLPSSRASYPGTRAGLDRKRVLKSLGVRWLRQVHSYHVARMVKTLRQAMTSEQPGLKVIIASGECQLAQQRKRAPERAADLAAGRRTLNPRFAIDADLCSGDHACIRLSGCPALTIAANPDPWRDFPVARVNQNCLGCGLCGEIAHAARTCPSFFRAEIVHNPTRLERWMNRLSSFLIRALQDRVEEPA